MQFRRSAMDVVDRSGPRFSGDAALLEWITPRPGRPPALGTRVARKPRSGGAWLALTMGVALLPNVGQAQTVEWVRSAQMASCSTAAARKPPRAASSPCT